MSSTDGSSNEGDASSTEVNTLAVESHVYRDENDDDNVVVWRHELSITSTKKEMSFLWIVPVGARLLTVQLLDPSSTCRLDNDRTINNNSKSSVDRHDLVVQKLTCDNDEDKPIATDIVATIDLRLVFDDDDSVLLPPFDLRLVDGLPMVVPRRDPAEAQGAQQKGELPSESAAS